jgi:excisionase family DNA binding protein
VPSRLPGRRRRAWAARHRGSSAGSSSRWPAQGSGSAACCAPSPERGSRACSIVRRGAACPRVASVTVAWQWALRCWRAYSIVRGGEGRLSGGVNVRRRNSGCLGSVEHGGRMAHRSTGDGAHRSRRDGRGGAEVPPGDEFLTVGDVAQFTKVDPQTVRNWIARGEIRAIRVRRTGPNPRSDFDDMLGTRADRAANAPQTPDATATRRRARRGTRAIYGRVGP